MTTQTQPNQRLVLKQQDLILTSRKNLLFDLVFGAFIPLFCLLYDPFVFRSDAAIPLLAHLRTFAYITIFLFCILLILWLCSKRLPSFVVALLVGVFAGGSLFSACIGIRLLPFSIIGMIIIVGIFGFIPFVTSFVFFRNMQKAMRLLWKQMPLWTLILFALAGFSVITIPAARIQWHILAEYPDYNDIPLYPVSISEEMSDWQLINSGENWEKTLTFETQDAPDKVVAYYKTILLPLNWRQSSYCDFDEICFGYESATDHHYLLRIYQNETSNGRYRILIRFQR